MADSIKDLNNRIENDHKALQRALNELEGGFNDLPEPADFVDWKLERLWQLRDFNNHIQKHFDLEESGGYNEELIRIAPQLVPQIEHLEEDHLKIISDLNHLLKVLKQIDHVKSAKIERVRVRVATLVAFIRDHETAETDIIQQAYYQDYGVGD